MEIDDMEMNSIIFLNEVGVLFCGGTVLVFQSRTINILMDSAHWLVPWLAYLKTTKDVRRCYVNSLAEISKIVSRNCC